MTTEDAWQIHESGVDHDGYHVTVGYDRVEHPDGSTGPYEWVKLPDIVVIVADTGAELVFVEQYRPQARERVLECPAGVVDDGESPVEAAMRELHEETGYRADSGRLLYSHNPLPGLLRHQLHVVFLTDLVPGEPDMDDREFIETRRVPIEDATEVARTPPANGMTFMAVLIAKEDELL